MNPRFKEKVFSIALLKLLSDSARSVDHFVFEGVNWVEAFSPRTIFVTFVVA